MVRELNVVTIAATLKQRQDRRVERHDGGVGGVGSEQEVPMTDVQSAREDDGTEVYQCENCHADLTDPTNCGFEWNGDWWCSDMCAEVHSGFLSQGNALLNGGVVEPPEGAND